MGGKSKVDNSQQIALQKEEAKKADDREKLREANIDAGNLAIDEAFHGKKVYTPTTTAYDWGTYKPKTASAAGVEEAQGVPEGYTVGTKKVTTPGKAGTKASGKIMSNPSGKGYIVTNSKGQPTKYKTYSEAQAAAGSMTGGTAASTTTQKGFFDAAGNFHPEGSAFDVITQTDTGQRSGSNVNDLAENFARSISDFFMPQVAEQYGKAKDQLTYAATRAGIGNSSAINTEVADLANQNELNKAQVRNKAAQGQEDILNRAAQEEQAAKTQLLASEDQTGAANQALSAMRNISLEQPDLTPLQDIFKIAAVGTANAVTGAKNRAINDQVAAISNQYGGSNKVVPS